MTTWIWGYSDRLSARPGDTVAFHLSATAPQCAVEIARLGRVREVVWTRDGIAVGTTSNCALGLVVTRDGGATWASPPQSPPMLDAVLVGRTVWAVVRGTESGQTLVTGYTLDGEPVDSTPPIDTTGTSGISADTPPARFVRSRAWPNKPAACANNLCSAPRSLRPIVPPPLPQSRIVTARLFITSIA